MLATAPATWPVVLVRYGRVPEIARFDLPEGLIIERGDAVVVETHRGPVVGEVLERVRRSQEPGAERPAASGEVVRVATAEDRSTLRDRDAAADTAFEDWLTRIDQWGVDVELLDVELSLDGEKTTLYVLCDRGAETTKLALQAAAAGLGLIDVQPVDHTGPVPLPDQGGGCGSCGH